MFLIFWIVGQISLWVGVCGNLSFDGFSSTFCFEWHQNMTNSEGVWGKQHGHTFRSISRIQSIKMSWNLLLGSSPPLGARAPTPRPEVLQRTAPPEVSLRLFGTVAYLSTYLSTYLSIDLSTYLSIYLTCQSINQSIYIYLSIYLSIYIYISISIYIYLYLFISIYIYLYLSIS